jgi:protein O-mannosyl-transferase
MMNSSFRALSILFLLLVVLGVGAYQGGFRGPMMYDSEILVNKTQAFARHDVGAVLRIVPQRPVAMLSFYLSYIVGGMDAAHFRFENVLILALASVVLVAFLAFVFEIPGLVPGEIIEKKAVAVGLGLLFLLHPLQTYVVMYVWQRQALLACLFYFCALAVYVATRTGRITTRIGGYGLTLGFFVLAVLSKENAITFPAVLVLMEIGIFQRGVRKIWKPVVTVILLSFLPVLVLSFLERPLGAAPGHWGILQTLASYYRESGLGITDVILSQTRIVFSHLATVLFPVPTHVKFLNAELISWSIISPPSTLVAVIGLVLLTGVAVITLRRRPLIGLGILFFLGNLVPESILVPQYLYFGYRALLPMAGLCLIVGDLLLTSMTWCRQFVSARTVHLAMALALGVVLVGLFLVTSGKAALWRDCRLMWSDVMAQLADPGPQRERLPYVHAFMSLGTCLHEKGMAEEAEEVVKRVLAINPRETKALVLLGKIYAESGDPIQAEIYFKQALETRSGIPGHLFQAHFSYASFLDDRRRYQEALSHYMEALSTGEHSAEVLNNIGLVLMALGKSDEATTYFEQALVADPGLGQAHLNLSRIFFSQGRYQLALTHCREAKKYGADCRPEALEKLLKQP